MQNQSNSRGGHGEFIDGAAVCHGCNVVECGAQTVRWCGEGRSVIVVLTRFMSRYPPLKWRPDERRKCTQVESCELLSAVRGMTLQSPSRHGQWERTM